MSVYAHYQKECARPTAAYLHTGTAVRKAVAAGLHKSTRSGSSQSVDETQQRHTIFWSLYFWETWVSSFWPVSRHSLTYGVAG